MKSIFITGGARGIGLATARLFLSHHWQVGLFDLDDEALQEAKSELSNDLLTIYAGNVQIISDVKTALKSFADLNGGEITVLHNNAGIVEVGEFDQQSLEIHHRIVDINLKGLITVTYEALPYLKAAKGAWIINMSSASAIYGNPEITTYAASKVAIKSLTEGWSIAFHKYQISVCDLLPIYVRTRMVDDYYQKYRNLQLSEVKLTATSVAQSVWKAAHSKKIHHYLGWETRVYVLLVKWLPASWLPSILRKVLKYYDR